MKNSLERNLRLAEPSIRNRVMMELSKRVGQISASATKNGTARSGSTGANIGNQYCDAVSKYFERLVRQAEVFVASQNFFVVSQSESTLTALLRQLAEPFRDNLVRLSKKTYADRGLTSKSNEILVRYEMEINGLAAKIQVLCSRTARKSLIINGAIFLAGYLLNWLIK